MINKLPLLSRFTQNGFAVLPIIVALSALVLIGSAGAIIYQTQKQNKTENEQLRSAIAELKLANTPSSPSNDSIATPKANIELEPTKVPQLTPKKQGITITKEKKDNPVPTVVPAVTTVVATIAPSSVVTDAEINKAINSLKSSVANLTDSIKTAETFVSTARNAMIKYPTSTLIQQSGQQVVDESNDLIFILNKMLSIQNERISVFSKYLGKGVLPSNDDISSLRIEYDNYFNQYERSSAKVESLLTTLSVNVSSL